MYPRASSVGVGLCEDVSAPTGTLRQGLVWEYFLQGLSRCPAALGQPEPALLPAGHQGLVWLDSALNFPEPQRSWEAGRPQDFAREPIAMLECGRGRRKGEQRAEKTVWGRGWFQLFLLCPLLSAQGTQRQDQLAEQLQDTTQDTLRRTWLLLTVDCFDVF